MFDLPTSLQPWPGSRSGETFLAEAAGEEVVLRIYGASSVQRGPLAPEIDAAVLELVRGLVPVPDVLEVRRGDPRADLPGLLVTSRLRGTSLAELLPRLDDPRLCVVGDQLGTLAGRLRHMVQPRRGVFTDLALAPVPSPSAEDLVDEDRSACLVHGDLAPRHLLLDSATLQLSGVVGWERAHSGRPLVDLCQLVSLDDRQTFVDAVLDGYRRWVPSAPDDLLDHVRATDPLSAGTGELPDR